MNIAAKTEYACIAVLELATQFQSGQPVRIREIANTHGIPSRFLVQILLQLKSAGVVTSTRGATGGYQLTRPPAEITLADVMSVVDGKRGELVSNAENVTPTSQALMQVWRRIAADQEETLQSVTFADLVEQAARQHENMYYI